MYIYMYVCMFPCLHDCALRQKSCVMPDQRLQQLATEHGVSCD